MKNQKRSKWERFCPAGLMMNSAGGTGVGDIEGPLEILFAGILGSLIGFVLGMLFGVITNIATMNARRGSSGGMHWAAYGAGGGALALAVIEWLS